MKPAKEKKPKHKSVHARLDNIENYLAGQTPFTSSYDPLVEYPKIEPVIDPMTIPAPAEDAPV